MLRNARLVLVFALAAHGVPAQDLYDEAVLRTFELKFSQPDWWAQLTANYASGTYIKAELRVGGTHLSDVGVRFRGNTSYAQVSSQKKPFEISTDAFVPGQELLGYHTLNLNNGYRDPTFVRELLCYWMFRQFVPAPKCNYALLVINGESWGPYFNVQQINKQLMREWFRDDEGNRYRAELQTGAGSNDSALTWLGTDPRAYQRGYQLKSELSPNPWVDLRDLCNALNNSPPERFPSDLAALLDIDEATRYLAGNNVVPALDSYIGNTSHNYYLFHDGWHDRFALIPWDLNAAFGGNNFLSVAQKVALDPFYVPSGVAQRPLVTKLLGEPAWRQRYLAHVRTLLDTVYDWKVLLPRIEALHALIAPALVNDTKRLYSMELFKQNLTKDVQIQVGLALQWIPGLESMVKGRRQFLLGHAAVALPAPVLGLPARVPPVPTVQDDVTVTVAAGGTAGIAAVTLFWRTRGGWNEMRMLDDGRHGDGAANDGVWGALFPRQPYGTEVEYYVGAQSPVSRGGAMTFGPRAAGHRPERYVVEWPRGSSPVALNELVAKNDTGIKDEKGEREDWLELFNASALPVSVAGLWLTDDLAVPMRWQIPAGTTLGPGQALLVWADNEPGDGPLHATFKLGADGDQLALFAGDGVTLLDALAFGSQLADRATGRLHDGQGAPWVTLDKPTPGAPNDQGACGHRTYSALDPLAHGLSLQGGSVAKVAGQIVWAAAGVPPLGPFAVVLAGAGGNLPVPGTACSWLLSGPVLAALALQGNAQGNATLSVPVPDDPLLVGARLYGQAFAPAPGRLLASNAVETTVCPK